MRDVPYRQHRRTFIGQLATKGGTRAMPRFVGLMRVRGFHRLDGGRGAAS